MCADFGNTHRFQLPAKRMRSVPQNASELEALLGLGTLDATPSGMPAPVSILGLEGHEASVLTGRRGSWAR